MLLTVPAFANGSAIPNEYAYCIPSSKEHQQPGLNRNPQMVWSNLPPGAQSLAIIVVDPDVPAIKTLANKEGMVISKDSPRVNFYHMVLVDIPPTLHEIKKAQDSDGITPQGKPPGPTPYGVRGVNSYSPTQGGYDGPCPPWNDEALHHYHFRLYALDVKTLQLSGHFDGPKALAAMDGHVLKQSDWVGTYTLNPNQNVMG